MFYLFLAFSPSFPSHSSFPPLFYYLFLSISISLSPFSLSFSRSLSQSVSLTYSLSFLTHCLSLSLSHSLFLSPLLFLSQNVHVGLLSGAVDKGTALQC